MKILIIMMSIFSTSMVFADCDSSVEELKTALNKYEIVTKSEVILASENAAQTCFSELNNSKLEKEIVDNCLGKFSPGFDGPGPNDGAYFLVRSCMISEVLDVL